LLKNFREKKEAEFLAASTTEENAIKEYLAQK